MVSFAVKCQPTVVQLAPQLAHAAPSDPVPVGDLGWPIATAQAQGNVAVARVQRSQPMREVNPERRLVGNR